MNEIFFKIHTPEINLEIDVAPSQISFLQKIVNLYSETVNQKNTQKYVRQPKEKITVDDLQQRKTRRKIENETKERIAELSEQGLELEKMQEIIKEETGHKPHRNTIYKYRTKPSRSPNHTELFTDWMEGKQQFNIRQFKDEYPDITKEQLERIISYLIQNNKISQRPKGMFIVVDV